MIKQLRKHIILVNMLLVGIVILFIFSVVCFNSYKTAYDNLEHGMNETIMRVGRDYGAKGMDFFGEISGRADNDNMEVIPPKKNLGKREMYLDTPMQLSSYIIVEVNSDGEIENKTESNVTMDDDTLKQCINIVMDNHTKSNQILDYGLMYVREDYQNKIKIIFADNGSIYTSLWNTVLISLALFIGGMIVIFLISLALSGFAVKPVKKAWEQQKQFVADASHELKTPLTVILANNNIMMSHTDSRIIDEKQWLESTEEEAQHMKQLIERMLFLAKSDAGRNPIPLSKVDFSEIVEGTALNFEPVAFEKEIEINPQIESEIIVNGNALQLKQLAHILIDNAVKYAESQSTITIILKKSGDTITFSVNNKGNVISPVDLEHIFDRFYRAEKSRTTKGYGLGLSIAQNIVQSMNGKLTVESTQENGTTFTVIFKNHK